MKLATLIVTALASLLIAPTAKADRPYVGRWESKTEHGFLETAEFTADGKFSFHYFAESTIEGTYVEIRPGILRLKATNIDLLGNDVGKGGGAIQWEIDNGCLIVTFENGYSSKYFPASETEEESSIHSPDQSKGADTPPIATPAPRATPGDQFGTRLILTVRNALDSHDWKTLTGMTVDGQTNYFGHQNTTDDYIAGDLQSDSRRYEWVHSNYYPDTFRNIHANRPDGTPVFFASMNFYTEARERNGTIHKANRRLIVAYAVKPSGNTAIYSISQIDPDSLGPHR